MKIFLRRIVFVCGIISYPCIGYGAAAAAPDDDDEHPHLHSGNEPFIADSNTGKDKVTIFYEGIKAMGLAKGGRRNLIVAIHPFVNVLPSLEAFQDMIVAVYIKSPEGKSREALDQINRRFGDRILPAGFGEDDLYKMIYEKSDPAYPLCILDIGGKFTMFSPERFKTWEEQHGKECMKFIRTAEDTMNGHLRYEAIDRLDYPVMSLARTPIKLMEDIGIGERIVRDSFIIMGRLDRFFQQSRVAFIGVGRLGSAGIYYASRDEHNSIVISYYDISPEAIKAHKSSQNKQRHCNKLGQAENLLNLIYYSKLIFLFTGNKPILVDPRNNFLIVRALDHKYLSVCTSLEDEIDLSMFEQCLANRSYPLPTLMRNPQNPKGFIDPSAGLKAFERTTVANDDFFSKLDMHIKKSTNTWLTFGSCSLTEIDRIYKSLTQIPDGHCVYFFGMLPSRFPPPPWPMGLSPWPMGLSPLSDPDYKAYQGRQKTWGEFDQNLKLQKIRLSRYFPLSTDETVFIFNMPSETYSSFLRNNILSNNYENNHLHEMRNSTLTDLDIFAWKSFQIRKGAIAYGKRQGDFYTIECCKKIVGELLNIHVFIKFGYTAVSFTGNGPIAQYYYPDNWNVTLCNMNVLAQGRPANFSSGGHSGNELHATIGAFFLAAFLPKDETENSKKGVRPMPEDAQHIVAEFWATIFNMERARIPNIVFPQLCEKLRTQKERLRTKKFLDSLNSPFRQSRTTSRAQSVPSSRASSCPSSSIRGNTGALSSSGSAYFSQSRSTDTTALQTPIARPHWGRESLDINNPDAQPFQLSRHRHGPVAAPH